MEALMQVLSVGADAGIWVLVAVAWRFDRRVYRLEMHNGLIKT